MHVVHLIVSWHIYKINFLKILKKRVSVATVRVPNESFTIIMLVLIYNF